MIDLTDRFPMRFDLARLQEEVRFLDSHRWVDHYDKDLADGWTAVPLVSHDGTMDSTQSQFVGVWGQYKRTAICQQLPYFSEVLDAFKCPHGRIRIMKMLPGTIIRPHRDIKSEVANYAFDQVRLHIPIFTNPEVIFSVGGENLNLKPGHLYYVNFSKLHYVRNDSDKIRVHLVLDLKINDFLRKAFPEFSPWERFEHVVARTTLPILWKLETARKYPAKAFWKMYEGSSIQRLRHRLGAGS
jgi:hypothetical protein